MARKTKFRLFVDRYHDVAQEYDVTNVMEFAEKLSDGEHRELSRLQAQFAGDLIRDLFTAED